MYLNSISTTEIGLFLVKKISLKYSLGFMSFEGRHVD